MSIFAIRALYLLDNESRTLELILFDFRASLTADKAVLAATRSICKIAITSFGSAFGAVSSLIGSDDASADKAETSTLFFFLEVSMKIVTSTITTSNQANEINITVFQKRLIVGIISNNSAIANYFCPLNINFLNIIDISNYMFR